MDIEKLNLNWNDIEKGCRSISERLYNNHYDVIVCLGRGSMIPSRLISEYLNINTIYMINVKSYIDINKNGKVQIEKFDYSKFEGKDLLIVDDVYTTGNTIESIKKEILNSVNECTITTATLFRNTNNVDKPDIYYAEYAASKHWIVFPWEHSL